MKSIYSKLILGFFCSVIISFTIVGIVIFRRTRIQIAQSTLNDLKVYVVNFSKDLDGSGILSDPEELSNEIVDINYVVYSDEFGCIYSDNSEYPISRVVSIIEQFHNSDQKEYQELYQDIETYGTKVKIKNKEVTVFAQKSIAPITNLFKDAFLLSGALIFFIGIIIFLIIADVIVKPLTRLSNATVELAKGNYNVKVNYNGNDEIGSLSDNFNVLARQLGETEKTRQRFISEISHEFQTPLTSIQGFATILKNENLEPEQKERYTDIILFESKRLSNLSKNMLQLTLLEGEDVKLSLSNFCLNEQLERVVSSLQENADSKNIEIAMKMPKRDVMIEGDENRLEQVWINLINNAIKYTNEDGYISVVLKKNVSSIEVSVNDTGIGMSEEAQRHIFKRFYREDKARSIGGNGLGLSIVKSIVDLHKGKIQVISQRDVGSEFHITLPVKQK